MRHGHYFLVLIASFTLSLQAPFILLASEQGAAPHGAQGFPERPLEAFYRGPTGMVSEDRLPAPPEPSPNEVPEIDSEPTADAGDIDPVSDAVVDQSPLSDEQTDSEESIETADQTDRISGATTRELMNLDAGSVRALTPVERLVLRDDVSDHIQRWSDFEQRGGAAETTLRQLRELVHLIDGFEAYDEAQRALEEPTDDEVSADELPAPDGEQGPTDDLPGESDR